jgi:hypothetical protein
MGGLPAVAGTVPGAENKTLLSVTCNRASGVVVPMPTCACRVNTSKMNTMGKIVFLILIRFSFEHQK